MRIVVVYESSYGNTHLIADSISEGLRIGHRVQVEVVPVVHASRQLLDSADLVIIGGPTHVHGMSREQTRQAAADAAHKPGSRLSLDADAEGPGLRAWFGSIGPVKMRAAAFDTRVDAPVVVTGRASKGISRQLRRHGFREIAQPTSFLVTKENELAAGQQAAARRWGERLAAILAGELQSPGTATELGRTG
jgi:Flavodoxin domain